MYSKLWLFELKNNQFVDKNIIFFIKLTKVLEVENFRFLANFRFLTSYQTPLLITNVFQQKMKI